MNGSLASPRIQPEWNRARKHVRGFHHQQDQEQLREAQRSILAHEEVSAGSAVRGQMFLRPSYQRISLTPGMRPDRASS